MLETCSEGGDTTATGCPSGKISLRRIKALKDGLGIPYGVYICFRCWLHQKQSSFHHEGDAFGRKSGCKYPDTLPELVFCILEDAYLKPLAAEYMGLTLPADDASVMAWLARSPNDVFNYVRLVQWADRKLAADPSKSAFGTAVATSSQTSISFS